MIEYINYQKTLLRWCSYLQVCRFYIDEDTKGKLSIKKTGRIWIWIYFAIWLNTLSKVLYLFMTYQGWLLEVEFLDKMSIWVYGLMIMEMAQETVIWCREYPLFEIILANWNLQQKIFRKLGEPKEIQRIISFSDKLLVSIHSVIVIVGCSSLMIQFYTWPKYMLNTYALFPYENETLEMIFAAHEFLFMWHAWVNAAGSILMCEIYSVSYTHLLREMTKAMKKLSLDKNKNQAGENLEKELGEILQNQVSFGQDQEKCEGLPSKNVLKNIHANINLGEPVPASNKGVGTRSNYKVKDLLQDYQKVMLATTEFNNWTGRWMGGTVATLYVQFVSDVFIMIQLLKEPGTDFMSVFFFAQDAFIGMFMMFTMLILMSRVHPASQEFLQEFKIYLKQDLSSRKYLLKFQNTMVVVPAKLGGHATTPRTVPKGIHTLINYYIAAAMWERPPPPPAFAPTTA